MSGRTYELWDRESRNLCGEFTDLPSALASVARTLDKHGPAAIASLILGYDDGDDGAGGIVAEGTALALLAEGLAGTITKARKWAIVCEMARMPEFNASALPLQIADVEDWYRYAHEVTPQEAP